jgi:hypothetical protein
VEAESQDRGSSPGRVAGKTPWRKKEKRLFFHGKKKRILAPNDDLTTYLQLRSSQAKKTATWKRSFFSSTNVPIAYQVSVRYALRPEYLTEFLAYHLSS